MKGLDCSATSVMTTTKRLASMDIAKFFAIYFVVWGHQYALFSDLAQGNIKRIIYSFHMPLFMLISGFFAHSALHSNFRQLVSKKARQLLLPVALCTLLEIAFTYLTTGSMGLHQARGIVVGNSWFIKTLFCILIVAFLALKVTRKPTIACILSCVVMFIMPHAYSLKLNYLLPFFWFGYLLRNNQCCFERHIKAITAAALIVFVFSFEFIYKGFFDISISTLTSSPMPIIGNYVTATAGCFMMLGVSFAIDHYLKCSKIKSVMCNIGQKTLEIYLLQTIILLTIIGNLFSYKTNVVVEDLLATVLSFVIIFFVLYIAKIINRNKYAKLLFFGKI